MISYDSIVTEVTARLGNRTDIATRVGRWINYAYFELLLNPTYSFFELDKSTTFSTVASTRSYDIVTPNPDLWFILIMRDATNQRRVRRASWKTFDESTITTGQPTRYARFGTSVELDPTPDAVYSILMRYRRRPIDLVSGSNMDGLGTEWEEPIVTLASVKGFEALKLSEDAASQRTLLVSMLQSRQDVPMLEDDDAEFTIQPVMNPNY